MVIKRYFSKNTNLGSLGEKFYIILQGEAKVIIPNPELGWEFKSRFEEYKIKMNEEKEKK
jgi:hypothetical protein